MKRLLFLFLLIIQLHAAAEDFKVTTNADSGPGSLREAIAKAAANGTAEKDLIYFEIPAGTAADVSILLTTGLQLSSNLVIDASVQPAILLGSSAIRISITRTGSTFFSGFSLVGIQDVEIYGFNFQNFLSASDATIEEQRAGIYLSDVKNIIIGAPGKGNSFGGNYAGILAPYFNARPITENVKISSNIIGLNPAGTQNSPNETGINISFLKNSIIGGPTLPEGNLIASNTITGIALGDAREVVTIQNNRIGVDITGEVAIPSPLAKGMDINGSASRPLIIDNIVVNQAVAIFLREINTGVFKITGNRIGVSAGGAAFKNGVGIHINFSKAGVIGDNNIIAYNDLGVKIELTDRVSILKNSFYCNKEVVQYLNLPNGKQRTESHISVITATRASGNYLPNSTIELFYIDGCPDCQGKTWLATVTADASGHWEYNGPITGAITSMGTDADGATLSGFSKPLIDDSDVQKTPVICGITKGSITNIRTYDASTFQWFDGDGNPVGDNHPYLTDVDVGTYRLVAGQGSLCDAISAYYTISASNNIIDDSDKDIQKAYCGASNGSIKKITIAGNLPRTWYNSAGTAISGADELTDVPAGVYYFKTGPCEIRSADYTIENEDLVFKAIASVLPATCGNASGSITVTGWASDVPVSLVWTDANGTAFSSDKEITGLAPGTYTLTASNDNGCTNPAGTFEIAELPMPVINTSNIMPGLNCAGNSVIITGITIIGTSAPYTYTWYDELNTPVYNGLQLTGVKPGKYYLTVTDKNHCVVSSPLLDFSGLTATTLIIPSAFTPNGDGVNDTWKIKGIFAYPTAEYYLYNRYGDLVFSSKGYTVEFNGMMRGKPLPVGVYYYTINLKNSCPILSGSVTIIK